MQTWALPTTTKQKHSGFTIVELLIVIVIIAILAAIIVVAYNGITGRANDTTVQSDLSNLMKKFWLFQAENGRFPTSSEEQAGIGLQVSKGAYLVKPQTTYNLVTCITSGGADMVIAAQSKTGNRYYISSKGGGVTAYTGASSWTGSNGYSVPCSDTLSGSSIPSCGCGEGSPMYGAAWKSWL